MKKLVGIVVLMAAGSVAAQQAKDGSTGEAALAYWTASYAGPELASVGCAAPQLPSEPMLSRMERVTVKAIQAWQECHRHRMASLAPEAAHKSIPAEVFATMTPAERDAATRHVAAVHAKLGDALQADAARVIAAQQAWREELRRNRDDYRERIAHSADRHAEGGRDTVRQNELARRP